MLKTIPVKVKYNTAILHFVNKHLTESQKLVLFSSALAHHVNVLFWMLQNYQSPVFISFRFYTCI